MKRITVAALILTSIAGIGGSTSLYLKLKEAREEAALYAEILQPILFCVSNNGAVIHDGTSLRCMVRGKNAHLRLL